MYSKYAKPALFDIIAFWMSIVTNCKFSIKKKAIISSLNTLYIHKQRVVLNKGEQYV